MPALHLEPWLTLGLTLVFLVELAQLGYFPGWCPTQSLSKHRAPRPLRPPTPDDCPFCRQTSKTPANSTTVVPYAQRKTPRGRTKTIDTQGYACPHSDCDFFLNTDAAVHALIGFGHHGRQEPIQDFYCKACNRRVTARRHTPLYRLKTSSSRVAQVLHAIAEGLSTRATTRVFATSETTLRNWLTRAGQHSRNLHERFLRTLHLTHVQLDEFRLKLYGAAEAKWLPPRPAARPQVETTGWIASDARTKLIPAFALGARTQAFAHQLVHEVAQHLAPGWLPVFSSDGLALDFYALTAHFDTWIQAANERRRTCCVDPRSPLASMPRSSNATPAPTAEQVRAAITASRTSVARPFLESRMTFDKPSSTTASPAAPPGPLASAREPGRADRLY